MQCVTATYLGSQPDDRGAFKLYKSHPKDTGLQSGVTHLRPILNRRSKDARVAKDDNVKDTKIEPPQDAFHGFGFRLFVQRANTHADARCPGCRATPDAGTAVSGPLHSSLAFGEGGSQTFREELKL